MLTYTNRCGRFLLLHKFYDDILGRKKTRKKRGLVALPYSWGTIDEPLHETVVCEKAGAFFKSYFLRPDPVKTEIEIIVLLPRDMVAFCGRTVNKKIERVYGKQFFVRGINKIKF